MAILLRAAFYLGCLLAATLPLSQSQQYNNETDRLALLSFKSMISDDPLHALDSWNTSLHACQWHGVSCKSGGGQWRVTALYLDSLNLSGTISPSLANLTFLEKLHLPENRLHGPIPQELGFLPHLQHINLSYNSLGGAIPSTLCHSSPLVNISLRDNMLQGEIPFSLCNCSKLQHLHLRANNLTGGAASAANLSTQLQVLVLALNKLSGTIPPGIGNLVNLNILQMDDNQLTGTIPPSLGNLFALTRLRLCRNKLSGTIPPSIGNLSSLTYLILFYNELQGALPSNMGSRLPHLQYLLLFENHFHGPLPMSLSNASSLQVVDLGNNNFNGAIPPGLGTLQDLSKLLLMENQLQDPDWNFFTSVTNCSNLVQLFLAENLIRGGGTLPSSIGNLSTSLEELSLGGNQISGTIPAQLGRLINLKHLNLSCNLLEGVIPDAIGSLQELGALFLDSNKLSGEIPEALGNLTKLYRLYLRNNFLEGSVPSTLGNCQSLELLSLDYNKLSGTIPKEILTLPRLSRYLGLSHNSFTGKLLPQVGSLINLVDLNISYNNLSGEVPQSLGQCQILQYLSLAGNSFHGPIPSSLRDLKGLIELDLSRNDFSGPIPESLESLNLTFLDLSFNHLEGEVPQRGVFSNVTAFSVDGNDKLCGGSHALNLPPCSNPVSLGGHRSSKTTIIVSTVSSAACLILLLVFILLYRTRNRRKVSASAGIKDPLMKLTYADLLKATDGFSSGNLVGVGSFGSVYRGILNRKAEEKMIAVKVLDLQQRGAHKSFMAECEALRSIKHRNLVKILTACSSIDHQGNDFKALVFEFLPNGNLDKWLHPEGGDDARKLTLIQRLNIAIDVACAVEYLHDHRPAAIIHCDLKPSNILLDGDMVAHVGDFGLAKSIATGNDLSSSNTAGSIQLRGSIGYVAPEYGMGNGVSTHGDVYSYGILLLEMLTGRRPTDDLFIAGLELHKFVEMALPDRVVEIIDQFLRDQEENAETTSNIDDIGNAGGKAEKCMHSLLGIGVRCSKKSTTERMQIGDVTRELYDIRDEFLRFDDQRVNRTRPTSA